MLEFLPAELKSALSNLNFNYLTEIRLRSGQAVILEYKGEYKYISRNGICDRAEGAIFARDVEGILGGAMRYSVHRYSEQLKNAFITVGGVRIGIAGEYVTEGGSVKTVKNVTSLNIRIPHEAKGCADGIFEEIAGGGVCDTLIFSPPGYGKTTVLRDLARSLGSLRGVNVLVFDERGEISAAGADGAYNLGAGVDVVRGAYKLQGFENAIRAMKPDIIVTDELYGGRDFDAVGLAKACSIKVIASSHLTDRKKLSALPFERFVALTGIGKKAVIYDKDFNVICHCDTLCAGGSLPLGG